MRSHGDAMRTARDRHPLTLRYAREVRETQINPFDWWEPPQKVSKPRRYRHSLRTRLARWVRNNFF